MVNIYVLSDLDSDFLLNQPETIIAKENVDKLSSGSIYFTINLNKQLRETLFNNLALDLTNIDSIPMRWIKGDTKPHIDRGGKNFDKTYLAYLTDSPGELIIDSKSYPINKGNAYIFDEGLSHETIGTGFEPRLLLGPMSESGISVGSGIGGDGGETIYIRQQGIGQPIQYSADRIFWNNFYVYSIIVTNYNTAKGILKIEFITDITFDISIGDTYGFFYCNSDNIQFGSTSLKEDGTRPIITINGITGYPGLIRNGTNLLNGFNNIYVFNLNISVNNSTLVSNGGWIGQSYFGKGASNNFIVNCSSNGPIIDAGGGIIGGYSGSQSGATLYIIGCSSSGGSGRYSGGIIGFYAGQNEGVVTCENCWSTGAINQDNGGIFGYYAGDGGFVRAFKCYSMGAIGGLDSGGIYGPFAGNAGTAQAQDCYSQGFLAADAGGIYGSGAASDSGLATASNCYSLGTETSNNGIFKGGTSGNRYANNCYSANGSWSDISAKSNLIGTPNPVVGTTWVASGGVNYQYELNNMGYTPYTIENIVFQGVGETPILNQSYNQTILIGESSLASIRPGYSYDKMNISGGSPSSYGTITINDNTGVISTTSTTTPGTYTITIRNTGSYNITSFTLSVIQNITPNIPICFPAGTPVLTDQGEIAIEKIDIKKHTNRGQQIVAITESIPDDYYLICIEKNSLAYNIPNRRTIISKDHKIMYYKKLVRAEYLIQYIPTIYKIPYNKQKLYNVLLNEYSTMSVNNMIVETMNPNNALAKVYSGNYTRKEKNELIKLLNKVTTQERKKSVITRNMFIA